MRPTNLRQTLIFRPVGKVEQMLLNAVDLNRLQRRIGCGSVIASVWSRGQRIFAQALEEVNHT